jgi:hypothetical protein
MRLVFRILVLLPLAIGVALVRAQGGPPFITDDPGTPGNHHWEINFGWIANHNPGQSYYEIPDVDMNYGWGDRIQLKYELPLAAATNPNNSTGVGLGESLLGVKWRYFEYHRRGEPKSDDNLLYSLGTYPQVSVNNPTSSVRRGIVLTGPLYYLPIEATAQIGPISLNGEIGRWIGNSHEPSQWGRGLIAGHQFNERLELYSEIYDLQDANRVDNVPKQRALTLDFGGRQSLDKGNHIRLLFMGGRAIQHVTRTNGEPSWIAYLGIQFLLGHEEKEVPGEAP